MNNRNVMLGTWAWGDYSSFGREYSEAELLSVFNRAVSEGFSMWDTAYVYGYGKSEKLLGQFLRTLGRDEYIVSDKFTPYHAKDFPEAPVRLMAEESLKNLDLSAMDIYWIHNPMKYKEWIPAMAELQKEGLIKHIGLSNFSLSELKESEEMFLEYGIPVYGVQNHYSLLCRSSETSGIIDYCNSNGIKFFSYMLLEQGALTGHYTADSAFAEGSGRGKNYNKVLGRYEVLNQRLYEIAEKYGISQAALLIAWGIAKGTIPIVGVTKEKYIDDIIAAAETELQKDDILQMEEAAAESGLRTIRVWEKEMK